MLYAYLIKYLINNQWPIWVRVGSFTHSTSYRIIKKYNIIIINMYNVILVRHNCNYSFLINNLNIIGIINYIIHLFTFSNNLIRGVPKKIWKYVTVNNNKCKFVVLYEYNIIYSGITMINHHTWYTYTIYI